MDPTTKDDALLQSRNQDSTTRETEQQISPHNNQENVEWSHSQQGVEGRLEQTNSGIAIYDRDIEDKTEIEDPARCSEQDFPGNSVFTTSNGNISSVECNVSTIELDRHQPGYSEESDSRSPNEQPDSGSVDNTNVSGQVDNSQISFSESNCGSPTRLHEQGDGSFEKEADNYQSGSYEVKSDTPDRVDTPTSFHEQRLVSSADNTNVSEEEGSYKSDFREKNSSSPEYVDRPPSRLFESENTSTRENASLSSGVDTFQGGVSETNGDSPKKSYILHGPIEEAQFTSKSDLDENNRSDFPENNDKSLTDSDQQQGLVAENNETVEVLGGEFFDTAEANDRFTERSESRQSCSSDKIYGDEKDDDVRITAEELRLQSDFTERETLIQTDVNGPGQSQEESNRDQTGSSVSLKSTLEEENRNTRDNRHSPPNTPTVDVKYQGDLPPQNVDEDIETRSHGSGELERVPEAGTDSEKVENTSLRESVSSSPDIAKGREDTFVDTKDCGDSTDLIQPSLSEQTHISEREDIRECETVRVGDRFEHSECNQLDQKSDNGSTQSLQVETTEGAITDRSGDNQSEQSHASLERGLHSDFEDDRHSILSEKSVSISNEAEIDSPRQNNESNVQTVDKHSGDVDDVVTTNKDNSADRTSITNIDESSVRVTNDHCDEHSDIGEVKDSIDDSPRPSNKQVVETERDTSSIKSDIQLSNNQDYRGLSSREDEVISSEIKNKGENSNKDSQYSENPSDKEQADKENNHSYDEESFSSDSESVISEHQILNEQQEEEHCTSSSETDKASIDKKSESSSEIKCDTLETASQSVVKVENQSVDTMESNSDKSGDINNEQKGMDSPTTEHPRSSSPKPDRVVVVRNGCIDDTAQEIEHAQSKVNSLFQEVNAVLQHYKDGVSKNTLYSFIGQNIGKFEGDLKSLCNAYAVTEKLCVSINRRLKELRFVTEELNNNMNKKLRDEDLASWLEPKTDAEEEQRKKLAEENVAKEKAAMAKATDARAAVAKAAVEIAESQKFAAEAEAESAESNVALKKAMENAQAALQKAEEARRAAEEKRKVEEEARRRADERAKQKAEEEKRKRDEEERQLALEAEKKGTSFEEEKRKYLDDKEQKEQERKNPANWPTYVYNVKGGDYDPGVGCVIRGIEGSLRKNDVRVKYIDQLSGMLTLVENEELVGNIIEIQPKDKDKKFSFEEPLLIAFPHCSPRGILSREPVIKVLQSNGKWADLNTTDVVIDDMKELKFVETKTKKFGTFAVVFKLKKDQLVFQKKGGKATSTVDSRVTFMNKSDTFRVNVNFTLEMQPVDSSTVSDIRRRKPEECSDLLSSSYIVKFSIPNRKFSKPLSVTVPVPPVSASRSKRPATAGSTPPKEKAEARPQTARRATSKYEDDQNEDELHMLVREKGSTVWTKVTNCFLLQSKNKDVVTFEMTEPYDRFCILRTKVGTPVEKVEKMLPVIETFLSIRLVHFFLRQRSENLYETAVACAHVNRVERLVRNLNDDGYDDGPPPSKEMFVKEGQKMEIRFRSNIGCVSEDVNLNFVYNSHIRNKVEFSVEELDKFAQKGFDNYRGFAQIYTKGLVPRPVKSSDDGSSGRGGTPKAPKVEMVETDLLIVELQITIPKPEPEPPKPLSTAPVSIKPEGTVDDKLLRHVSSELGDEWRTLAQYLNIKSMRIQAILRQHVNKSNEDTRYDMLVSWAKRIPRSTDKTELLCKALTASGRGDIAEDIKKRDEQVRKVRAHSARDSYLRKAFVKIAQDPKAGHEWRKIALQLGVPDDEVQAIESNKPSGRERCYQSLKRWREIMGDTATMTVLTRNLKICKYSSLAREVESLCC